MSRIATIIETLVPATLLDTCLRSLRVPQIGPFHKEGPTMESHLELMVEALEQLEAGKVVGELSDELSEFLVREVSAFDRNDLLAFIFLHDLGKMDCMQAHHEGASMEINLHDWETSPAQGIVEKISYIGHDERSGEILDDVGYDNMLVMRAVRVHMRATMGFDSVNIDLMSENFRGWSEREITFQVISRYLDQAGSIREDGKPDLAAVEWLYRSWNAGITFDELVERLVNTERLDQHELGRVLPQLRKSRTAFIDETLDEAYGRIVAKVTLPEVTEVEVREALTDAIAQGLSDELVEAIVADMTSTGKLGRETGKSLGRFNRLVRPALARL